MKLEFPVKDTVMSRYSVRTYKDQLIPEEIKNRLQGYINNLSNPFGADVSFFLLEAKETANNKKLGTYGMIKGAKEFFGSTVKESDYDMEGLGYEFEKLVLYAASIGLGTCWLGGTFKRTEFAVAMEVKEDDIFPAISPIGYPAARKSLSESLVRRVVKAEKRKPWETLFFDRNFSFPLTAQEAGPYAFPLEMVRLAPSASNKQPWRIIRESLNYHFYEDKTPGYGVTNGYDIQKVDMGIAACHFHMAALEIDQKGEFKILPLPSIELPENMQYRFSWVC